MRILILCLLLLLAVCAIATASTKRLLGSVIIYMAFSVILSILWAVLEAPDLAVTEAAVGVGISSLLFFVTLRKIHLIDEESDDHEQK